MLWSLAWLAPFSLLMSDLPRGWAWPLALTALVLGVVDAWRHGRLKARALVIPIGRRAAMCDGQRMQGLTVQWRGSFAFLRWRDADGHVRRLVFWPDTLPSASRRELRLAAMRIEPAREPASMAG